MPSRLSHKIAALAPSQLFFSSRQGFLGIRRNHIANRQSYGHRKSQTSSVTVHSSSGSIFIVVGASAALFGCCWVLWQSVYPQRNPLPGAKHQTSPLEGVLGHRAISMTNEVGPGRPSTMTAEEELKLKEFWRILLHHFGVEEEEVNLEPTERTTTNASTTAKSTKKKRFGLLGRKKTGAEEDNATKGAVAPRVAPNAAMDGEDKYGLSKEYQKLLESQSPAALREAFWEMVKSDDPDGLLLRFLRARKWNVQDALVMLMATMHWRMEEVKVDSDVCRRGEAGALQDSESSDERVKKDGHDFLEQFRIGKSYNHGIDKEGRPMCFVRVRLHRAGEQTESSLERYTVYTIETARLLLTNNVDTACLVFDMTNFSLANMDYAPVKFMIKCFEANYPESLGVVLVHKSPWLFHGIWKIIKGWLDPVVAGKVHFTKDLKELSEFIALDHIPQEMGGEDPYKYEYVPPVDGENDKMVTGTAERDRLQAVRAETVKQYESATMAWLNSGSHDNASHTTSASKRKALGDSLRTEYWELEPYVRARTFYDRIGLINPGGFIRFYPNDKPAAETAGQDGTPATSGVNGSAKHEATPAEGNGVLHTESQGVEVKA